MYVYIIIQNSPQLIVGTEARVHTYDYIFRRYGLVDTHHHFQRPSRKNLQYSFMIGATFFAHVRYLYMYTFELPRRFFNFVERHNNCEDIFFSGMVAEFLAKNGYNQPCCIWVEAHSKHLEKIASMYNKIKCWFVSTVIFEYSMLMQV